MQLLKFLYCKLLTIIKQLPNFPHKVQGLNHRPQRWEASVLPLVHHGPLVASISCSNPYVFGLEKYVSNITIENILAESRSKVKLRSHYDIACLQPLTNILSKYQHTTAYRNTFRDTPRQNILYLPAQPPACVAGHHG